MNKAKLAFLLSTIFLVFLFLFIPHTIELTVVLETWFPYKGLALYKDVPTFHFPLGRSLLYPLHIITNWNLRFDPFVGLLIGILTLAVIYKFGKKFLSQTATSIALLFFALFYWYFATAILYFHEQLIGLLLAISLYLLFDKKYFLLGLTLSLAEFSGQIATLTITAFVILTFYTMLERKNPRREFIAFATAFLIPPLIISLYFLFHNALYDFWFWNTAYYLEYSKYAGQSSLLDLPLKGLLPFFFPLFLIVFTKPKSTIFLLTISTVPFIIFSVYHPHHANYALPILAIGAGYAFEFVKKSKSKPILIFLSIFFGLVLLIEIVPWYLQRLKPYSFPNTKIVNDVYPDDPMYGAVEWVKQNTSENDTLMVVADPLFYMRADRLPASRPSKGLPYSWEPIEKISVEIRATPPDYWVLDTNSVKRIAEINLKPKMVDFINEELKSGYSMRAAFENWQIWERNLP